MVRLIYGMRSSDTVGQTVTDPDASGGKVWAPSAATFDVFTTRTGATQHTDLLRLDGTPITQVSPDIDGRVIFQGQDGYSASYWLEQTTARSAPRYLIEPIDLAGRTAPTGFYTMPASGIPASDLEPALQDAIGAAGRVPALEDEVAAQGLQIDGILQGGTGVVLSIDNIEGLAEELAKSPIVITYGTSPVPRRDQFTTDLSRVAIWNGDAQPAISVNGSGGYAVDGVDIWLR